MVAANMETKMRALPMLQDVNSDLQITNPQLRVEIDRDRAATLGITPAQIEDALYSAYGSRQVSTIYTPTNQYFVHHGDGTGVPERPCGAVAALPASRSGKLFRSRRWPRCAARWAR